MFIVASNGTEEVSKIPPTLLPGPRFFTVMNHVYEALPAFNQALINSFYVGTVVAVAQVFFSALAGFAYAKLNFKGQKFMVLFVVFTMMLPSQLGIIALFKEISMMNLIDSLGALIVPALVTAFGVFWMRQVIDAQVPNELLEAASIDGAGFGGHASAKMASPQEHSQCHGRRPPARQKFDAGNTRMNSSARRFRCCWTVIRPRPSPNASGSRTRICSIAGGRSSPARPVTSATRLQKYSQPP